MMKNYPLIATNPQNSWLAKLRDFANFVLIMGSAAYGLHFLWRNYIYPWLYKTKMEEDSNTRLQRTLEALDDYNGRAESTDIKSEIISLKGLLLSSSRFP